MAKLTKSYPSCRPSFTSDMLKIGELMEIESSKNILLRTNDGFTYLSKTYGSWKLKETTLPLIGRKLNQGESVTLTQE